MSVTEALDRGITPRPTSPISDKPTNTPTEIIFSPTETPSPSEVSFEVCSPLAGIELSEIDGIVSNPFDAPEPGLDDGHHGVDLAFYSHGDIKTIQGLGIQAVLGGRVAASIQDSAVYGNMVIIETPLETMPEGFLTAISPTPTPTVNPANIRLTCPTPSSTPNWDGDHQSLYLLYAHMDQPSGLTVGEMVGCGQAVGAVGTTGRSVNPHLHLEARWGPAGVTFSSMSHYDTQATVDEMSAYCTWRVSGTFQMIDPMLIINTKDPEENSQS